jgi:hypothetical protein
MKNLIPIVPSYLLEFPLPTLSRLSSSGLNQSPEKVSASITNNSIASSNLEKTASLSSLPNQEGYHEQLMFSNSPTSTTSSPATSGLVGDFKTLTSNISGVLSTSSSSECIHNINGVPIEIDTDPVDLTQNETSQTTTSSCTSNAVNPNKSFSILVS